MKILHCSLLLFIFFLQAQDHYQAIVPRVRVKIDETPMTENKKWVIAISGPVLLADETKKGKKINASQLTITCKKNCFYINGKPCLRRESPDHKAEPVTCLRFLIERGGTCTYNDHCYYGYLELRMHKETVLLINAIELEEYVYAVVCAESIPCWPLEVQKTQSILTRSYVLAIIADMEKRKEPYHVTNTNLHQVYKGNIGEFVQIRTAVKETKGKFLAHDGSAARTEFDICCGGAIPKKMQGIDFKKAPYMARGYACKYCKHYTKVYSWKASYEKHMLEAHLQKYIPELKRLERIVIAKKDAAGLVHELLVHGKGGVKKKVTGQQWYSWFKEIKSFMFTIKRKGTTYHIQGNGTGHHRGYCQWGGRRMAELGFKHGAILKYYYPGTQLQSLPKKQ